MFDVALADDFDSKSGVRGAWEIQGLRSLSSFLAADGAGREKGGSRRAARAPTDSRRRPNRRGSGVAHFYHVYCGGEWREPVAEHLTALHLSAYEGPFVVGLVGSPLEREKALVEISAQRRVDHVIHADRGTEQVTVNEVDRYADDHEGAVMYAHTKGAATASHVQADWRRRMTQHVVLARSSCEDGLAQGYDAVGCYWIASDDWPGEEVPHKFWGWGHFSGNFWIADCAYLRTLPAPSMTSRFGAEAWLGSGAAAPRILDLLPGSPSPSWKELARRRAVPR